LSGREGTPDKPVSDVRLFLTAEEYSIGGVQCAPRATNLLTLPRKTGVLGI